MAATARYPGVHNWSEGPTEGLRALKEAGYYLALTHDLQQDISQLLQQLLQSVRALRSDDPAVRFAALELLEQLHAFYLVRFNTASKLEQARDFARGGV
jgi:hypothetical protein